MIAKKWPEIPQFSGAVPEKIIGIVVFSAYLLNNMKPKLSENINISWRFIGIFSRIRSGSTAGQKNENDDPIISGA